MGRRGVVRSLRRAGPRTRDRQGPLTTAPVHHDAGTAAGSVDRLQRDIGNRAVTATLQRLPQAPAPDTTDFSATELDWIDQVWDHPGIRMLFLAYDNVPAPVLARVKRIVSKDGTSDPRTEGVHRPEAEEGDVNVEIADSAYTIPDRALASDGSVDVATSEEEFKSVLIHELMHFFELHTHHIDATAVPTIGSIELMFTYPERFGYEPFAFGWFKHKETKRAVHLDDVEVATLTSGYAWTTVEPGSPEAQAKEAKAYEPRTDDRNLEEDIATTIAYFLTSERMRELLKAVYPQRFAVMTRFFTRLLPAHLSIKGAE